MFTLYVVTMHIMNKLVDKLYVWVFRCSYNIYNTYSMEFKQVVFKKFLAGLTLEPTMYDNRMTW